MMCYNINVDDDKENRELSILDVTRADSNKISRIISMLIPHAEKSKLNHRHGAVVLVGGKPVVFGHNHDRMTNKGKITLSFHAEMDVLNQYANINGAISSRGYLNDCSSLHTMKAEWCALQG